MTKITANTIVNALSLRHYKDLFIPECKTGSSSYHGCPRFDAWVMKKSWASPSTIGYEIKVDSNDFKNDNKWQNYLPYSNEFYFVPPYKIILPDEVPECAGLLNISNTGTRLYTKKKAPYRDIEIPDSIFRYILMWRTVVQGELFQVSSKKKYWEQWLKEKEYDDTLGHRISKKLRETIQNKIEEVEKENNLLVQKMGSYDKVVEFIKKLGIDPNNFHYIEYDVEKKLKKLLDVIPSDLEYSINNLSKVLQNFQENLDKLKNNDVLEDKSE